MSIPADSRPGESATRRDAVLVNQFRQQHRAMSNIFPSSRSVSSRPSVFANGIRLCASAILYCVATLVSLNLVGESPHGECEHGCATKATTKASVDVGVQALLHTLGRRQLVQSSHRVHLQGHQPHTTSAHSATQRLSTHPAPGAQLRHLVQQSQHERIRGELAELAAGNEVVELPLLVLGVLQRAVSDALVAPLHCPARAHAPASIVGATRPGLTPGCRWGCLS